MFFPVHGTSHSTTFKQKRAEKTFLTIKKIFSAHACITSNTPCENASINAYNSSASQALSITLFASESYG
jgi:hypothetical protein